MGAISLQGVLAVVGEFDESGGASLGLVAWELCVDERLVSDAWERASATGLIAPAGFDQHEQLWRLTPAGWMARPPSARAPESTAASSSAPADAASFVDRRGNR
jgi:hypothetical protein